MSARRTRAASRREESIEPQDDPGSAVARRTRSSSKRANISDTPPQSKSTQHLQSGIPQRGTRRQRRRSLESVATNDFPKSLAEEQPLTGIAESVGVEDMSIFVVDSQSESYEDRLAKLQDVLDFDLPKLCRWCDKAYELLKSFAHPERSPEERRRLKTTRKPFNLARRPLAADDAPYIDISSSDLPYRDDPAAQVAMQKATRSANLISLLFSLTDLEQVDETISPFLRDLDSIFPTLLDPSSTHLQGQELAFQLRCRWLVERLSKETETEPLVLAATVFCKDPASTSEEAVRTLGQGEFRTFSDAGQGEDFTSSSSFKTQLNTITEKISLLGREETERYLNTTLPRHQLLEQLREWALDMYAHVNKAAEENMPPPEDDNEGETNGDAGREESEGLIVVDHDEPDGDSDSESSSEDEEYHQLKNLVTEPSYIQDPASLAAVRRSERGGPKRTRMEPPTDPQPAGGKLTGSQIREAILRLDPADILESPNSHDGIDDEAAPPDTRPPRSRSRSDSRTPSPSRELGTEKKRPRRWEDESYAEENDDFEVNEQLIDESRRIRYDSADTPRPARKRRPRFAGNPKNNDAAGGSPPGNDNAPASSNLRERDLAALSQAARANRLAHRGKGHQVRERWSDVDTDHLLDLIADRGLNCSWAAMERAGGFQTPRNQQAIRDKARNLKKGYLCADAILPSGFDYVYLSKKERDDVIASGHNPDRAEGDVDERGRVVRNLWTEGES